MSAWSEFYSTRAHTYSRYAEYAKIRYAPFITKILNRVVWNSSVAEIGCGMATITTILKGASPTLQYVATDLDREMLDIAKLHIPHGILLLEHDAIYPLGTNIAKFDVVHSHGLLEHFANEPIQQIIHSHRDAYQVHYVPGLYDKPSFGDERLLSVDQWKKICSPDEIHTFNDDLDYALIFHPH